MTIEEILNGVTILETNGTSNTPTIIYLIISAIVAIATISVMIMCIRNNISPIITVLIGVIALAWAANTIICVLYLVNPDVRMQIASPTLYVNLNDVSIESISQYFKLNDVTASDGQTYAHISSIYDYHYEINQILHGMNII